MAWKLSRKDLYYPTKEELLKSKEFLEKCEEAGIVLGIFTDNLFYGEDEAIAFKLISEGKEVPEDIKKRLWEKQKKIDLNVCRPFDFDMEEVDKDIREMIGDKFDKG